MATTIRIVKIERNETRPGVFRIDIHLPNGIIYHFGSLQRIKDFADKPIGAIKTSQLKVWKFLQALRDSGISASNYQTYVNRDIAVSDVEVV